MKRIRLTALLALLAITTPLATSVPAQPLRGSYFFETSLLRSKLNPAFAPQTDLYISIPVAGYASADILSNVGLGNFLFADGDKNYTFLNDRVDAAVFFDKLPQEDPFLNARYETDLVGGGYRLNDKLFLTAALSVTGYLNATVPQELLRFAKSGRSGATRNWSIQELNASYMSYATLSAGASYDLGELVPGLSVGGKLKLMTGLKSAVGTLHRLDVKMEDDCFSATTRGVVDLAGFSYDPEDGFRKDGSKLRGFGAAIDLGAEYRLRFDGLINGLNLSASVGNLGRLSFGRADRFLTEKTASFEGFQDVSTDFGFQAALDQVVSDFSKLLELDSAGKNRLSYVLAPEIHAGIEVPFLNEMLSAGLLYSYNLYKSHLTLAFNASPLEWLNLSANYTFGPADTMGFYAEYIPTKYVSVFLGFEKASWKTNKHLLGIRNLTESLCLGINILL